MEPTLALKTTVDPALAADSFEDDVPAGQVIGSRTAGGVARRGADAEGIMSIDGGALRIGYMQKPGWGRHALAYGPFPRRSGLAFSAFLLNGHTGSQTYDDGAGAMRRFLKFLARQLAAWIPANALPSSLRTRLHPKAPHYLDWPPIRENLAAGWFGEEAPADPAKRGNAFLVRATGIENGALSPRVNSRTPAVVHSLQNVPLYLVVILRDVGAAYYVASLPGTRGAAPYPAMRLVAIDTGATDPLLYAGISQSILGEIGFRADTRVYGIRVADVPELASWHGTAHAADMLQGSGPLGNSDAETGGRWTCLSGSFERGDRGAAPSETPGLVTLTPPAPSGCIHVRVRPTSLAQPAGIVWRVQDSRNFLCLRFTRKDCRLFSVRDGTWEEVAAPYRSRLRAGVDTAIQILDDGAAFRISCNGSDLSPAPHHSGLFQAAAGVGLQADGPGGVIFSAFEAHPRCIPIPHDLMLGEPWSPARPATVAADQFEGSPRELEGTSTTTGEKIWSKSIGRGEFRLTGSGAAKVQADPRHPNPGRTAYTIAWNDEEFADVEVMILPPGTGKDEGEKGRGGVIFWQDPANYVIVNTYLDDWKVGKSISSFFRIDDSEDTYRAVWTNVGDRIHWGTPYILHVAFDGMRYLVHLNGEAVLYRSLSDIYPGTEPLAIRRVGIVANWEFGDDTGSSFLSFRASERRHDQRRPHRPLQDPSPEAR